MGTRRANKYVLSLDSQIARELATVLAALNLFQREVRAWQDKAVLPQDFVLVLGITRRTAC